MKVKLREKMKMQGRITFRNFELSTSRAIEIDQYLASTPNVSRETYQELIKELGSICEVSSLSVDNQILLGARTEVAKRLAGTPAYTGTINYGALGTGSTPVTDGDTALDTEVARAPIATINQIDDQVIFDFYFNKSSTNGTYQEFSLVIDGSASADSGLLFNRALTGGWVKSSLVAMTVSIQVNINHA